MYLTRASTLPKSSHAAGTVYSEFKENADGLGRKESTYGFEGNDAGKWMLCVVLDVQQPASHNQTRR